MCLLWLYKCVYSDFVYHYFQTINSMDVRTTLQFRYYLTTRPTGEGENSGRRASTREAPTSVLLSSRKMQRSLQGARIRVRPARDLSQLWNLSGCPKSHHNPDRHCPKAAFLMINIKIWNKDKIGITDCSFNNRLQYGEAWHSSWNVFLVLTAQDKKNLLFGFWVTLQCICRAGWWLLRGAFPPLFTEKHEVSRNVTMGVCMLRCFSCVWLLQPHGL